MARKPRVLTKCVANTYARDGERIIEVAFGDGDGCLIRFVKGTAARPHLIEVYRIDGITTVVTPTVVHYSKPPPELAA